MRIRKGLLSLSLKKLKRLEIGWLLDQARKYRRLRHSYRTKAPELDTGPIIAHLFCTHRCNSKCWMCDIPQRKPSHEMTTEDCLSVMAQLKDLGVTGLSFTGGEPLLRDDIFALLREAMALGFSTMLVTNGLELDTYVDEVLSLDLSAVNISLDGSCEAIHDGSRGVDGAFARTTENVRLLVREIRKRRKSTEVVISTVISRNNCDDIGNILALCGDMGIERVILCPVHLFDNPALPSLVAPVPCTFDLSSFLLSHKQRGIIDNSDAYLKSLSSVLSGAAPPEGCSAAYTTIFIDFEMNVYPCKAHLELQQPIAHLREGRTLREIWNSREYVLFRKESLSCRKCFMTVNREFDGLFK